MYGEMKTASKGRVFQALLFAASFQYGSAFQRFFVNDVRRVCDRKTGVVNMGLFDGLKDAFTRDDMQAIEADRETPFDRWMGISTMPMEDAKKDIAEFVDSMSEENYIKVSLSIPMGIVFEENDPSTGGVFVASLSDGGNAVSDGSLRTGDQLVSVNGKNVRGMDFDTCLGMIVDSKDSGVNMIFFRGGVANLYGNRGPSEEWFSEFLGSGPTEKAADSGPVTKAMV